MSFSNLYHTPKTDLVPITHSELEYYYWEHFGMVDDKSYADGMKQKLEKYAEAGKFPGEDLIITMETKGSPISTDNINRVIEHYLL